MRVLTVDDNAIIRMGLRAVLEASPEVDAVRDTDDADEALRLTDEGEVDVVLLDVRMPRRSGLDLLPELVRHVPVVMLTHDDESETLAEAMAAGASGYVVHGALDPDGLVDALRMCLRGGTVVAGAEPSWSARAQERPDLVDALTQRERDVMNAVVQGLTNPQIAQRLFLSEKTVKNNINRIFAKLAVTSRGEAIARWQGLGPS